MPSLRHPVGPLPSAIYWRRRLVVAVVALAVIALVVWLLVSPGGGGGGGHSGAAPTAPASSIGPSGGGGSNDGASGTPGGGASGTPGPGSSASGSAGAGGTSGGSGGGASGGGGQVSVSGGSSGGGAGGKGGVPVNTGSVMALPACAASDLGLVLDGDRSTYAAGQNPVFRLTVKNTGAADCRIDVGRTAAVVTISSASQHHVWSSGDCASDKTAQWVEAVAGGSVTVSYDWGRVHSSPGCPSETNGFIAGGGTFVAQASLSGVSNQPQWQFRLVAAGS